MNENKNLDTGFDLAGQTEAELLAARTALLGRHALLISELSLVEFELWTRTNQQLPLDGEE
jgi:hypothetical protein